MGFIVKLVLVLAVVAGGVWAWMTFHPAPAAQPVAQEVQTTPPPAPPPPPPGPTDMVSASGSSDADLQGDLGTLDGQVQSAQTDSASVDSSFSDKPVQQTE